jgi:hypothetical protein
MHNLVGDCLININFCNHRPFIDKDLDTYEFKKTDNFIHKERVSAFFLNYLLILFQDSTPQNSPKKELKN